MHGNGQINFRVSDYPTLKAVGLLICHRSRCQNRSMASSQTCSGSSTCVLCPRLGSSRAVASKAFSSPALTILSCSPHASTTPQRAACTSDPCCVKAVVYQNQPLKPLTYHALAPRNRTCRDWRGQERTPSHLNFSSPPDPLFIEQRIRISHPHSGDGIPWFDSDLMRKFPSGNYRI